VHSRELASTAPHAHGGAETRCASGELTLISFIAEKLARPIGFCARSRGCARPSIKTAACHISRMRARSRGVVECNRPVRAQGGFQFHREGIPLTVVGAERQWQQRERDLE